MIIVSSSRYATTAPGLFGQASGLEADRAGAEAAVVDDGLGEGDVWTLHVGPSLSFSLVPSHIVVVCGVSIRRAADHWGCERTCDEGGHRGAR